MSVSTGADVWVERDELVRELRTRLAAALAIVEPLEALAREATAGRWTAEYCADSDEHFLSSSTEGTFVCVIDEWDADYIEKVEPATILRLAKALRGETE